MVEVVIVTRPDDGWHLGYFETLEKAKQWVDEEHEYLDAHEPDYWKGEVGNPESVTLI